MKKYINKDEKSSQLWATQVVFIKKKNEKKIDRLIFWSNFPALWKILEERRSVPFENQGLEPSCRRCLARCGWYNHARRKWPPSCVRVCRSWISPWTRIDKPVQLRRRIKEHGSAGIRTSQFRIQIHDERGRRIRCNAPFRSRSWFLSLWQFLLQFLYFVNFHLSFLTLFLYMHHNIR